MTFSVLIPAYKSAFLAEALESVIRQSWKDWELIVVDDCSPEELEPVVRPFCKDERIRYYRNERNFGAVNVVANWNKCLEYSTGDYVICIGDDDRLSPGCLERLAALIDKYPDLGVYHCGVAVIDERGEVKETLDNRPELESSLEMIGERWKGRRQFIGDFCFNRELLVSNGGFFYLPLAWGADDISAYIAAKGDGLRYGDGIANLNEALFQYRSNSLTISSSSDFHQKLLSMKSYADWFADELGVRAGLNACDSEDIERLKGLCNAFYIQQAKYYIRQDVHSDWRRMAFWLNHVKETGLPLRTVLAQSVKGILK